MSLCVVIEGDTDEPVVRKLAQDAGIEISKLVDMRGKAALDAHLEGFNSAAKGSPWLVLRDLDQDADCAPEFVTRLRFRPTTWMAFRLAVRALESWLLADREGVADFLGVSVARVPERPDEERNPTQTLVNLARKSNKRSVRQALVPRAGDRVAVGPGYEAAIIEFGVLHWSLERAVQASPSLHSARLALRALSARWARHAGGGSHAR